MNYLSILGAINWLSLAKGIWDNIYLIFAFLALLFFLNILITITKMLRSMKDGFNELRSPLGASVAFVMLAMIFVIYIIVRSKIQFS